MLKIDTIKNNERMSTQDLLLQIEAAVNSGETDFEIAAYWRSVVASLRQNFKISCNERGATCRLYVFAEYRNYC